MKEEFLKEYKQLCLKYGLQIAGCGECGSAFLLELNDDNKKINKLVWRQDYEVIHFANKYDEGDEDIVGMV